MYTNRKPTILIADDEEPLRRLYSLILGRCYNLIEVANGECALGILKKQGIDLLITDDDMGEGIRGTQLAKIANEKYPDLVVLLISGTLKREDAMNAGAHYFLQKPFDMVEFRSTVEKALNNKH